MKPIRTEKTEDVYGAPKGMEADIGGLPFYRRKWNGYTEVVSIWEPSSTERAMIANGANILLAVVGEPIHPVLIDITDQVRVEST